MIGIIDYGLGNLTSVLGAVEKLGFKGTITNDPDSLAACDKLILPGVGAFPEGMANLHERGMVDVLNDLALNQRKPTFGICLGFQLLGLGSDEFSKTKGLGWIDASVTLMRPEDMALRVPHVGWNEVTQVEDCILFDDIPNQALFYFVHKYKMQPPAKSTLVGTCNYGGVFTAAVQHGNIFGTQFHPEKSQQHGLTMLHNFLEKA